MRSVDTLGKKHKRLSQDVGALTSLSTTNKSSIVTAINELFTGLVSLGWVPPTPPPPPVEPGTSMPVGSTDFDFTLYGQPATGLANFAF